MAPKRLCYLCEKKPAKVLDGSPYVHAYKGKAFCSVRCAAKWALVEVDSQLNSASIHECTKTGQLELDEGIGCCEPDDE